MRHLLQSDDFTAAELDRLMDLADDIIARPEHYKNACEGKKLATLFFEPSTRTRLSFEAAMYELGGHVLSVSSMASSSAAKGESVQDTVRVAGCYADIIAMRHPQEGAPYAARRVTTVPLINAGDGAHHHPTQTLADILTIRREKGRLDHLTVGLCGDLKYGRTVHSLVECLSERAGVRFVFISPSQLAMPEQMLHTMLEEKNVPYTQTDSLEKALPELDVLYMTRVQRERFDDLSQYEALKDSYVLDLAKMKLAKHDCIVLHPLPRVNEIDPQVDADPRACYFKEVYNGKIMRMALILTLLGLAGGAGFAKSERAAAQGKLPEGCVEAQCSNAHCISQTEQGLPHLAAPVPGRPGVYRCVWCDHLI
ncbi:MAG: aspartate carbamoyltransferase [Pygmaiobacter massiliensis]|nr:aspartate carbamoyltransferase [Pygmaiobacter massiliensis]